MPPELIREPVWRVGPFILPDDSGIKVWGDYPIYIEKVRLAVENYNRREVCYDQLNQGVTCNKHIDLTSQHQDAELYKQHTTKD